MQLAVVGHSTSGKSPSYSTMAVAEMAVAEMAAAEMAANRGAPYVQSFLEALFLHTRNAWTLSPIMGPVSDPQGVAPDVIGWLVHDGPQDSPTLTKCSEKNQNLRNFMCNDTQPQ